MSNPLQGSLAKTIGRAMSGLFYDAVLTRTTVVENPDEPWNPGTETVTDYPCKAMVDTYSDYAIANTLVEARDRKVLILATSLAVTPAYVDRVSIRGVNYQIVNVKTDPALAVWECQCRA